MTVDSPGRAAAVVTEAAHDRDPFRAVFYILVIGGIVLGLVLGVRDVVDRPVIRLSEVRSTQDGATVRAQVLATNSSDDTTYCLEITFEALDAGGLSLATVVGAPRAGGESLRPGQSSNFAATFAGLSDRELREELDDVLAFVTDRQEC